MRTSLVPFRGTNLFGDFRREFDSLFNRFFSEEDGGHELSTWHVPAANVAESEGQYEVTLDLPGIKPDELNVEFKHGELWISGQRQHEHEEKGKTWHRVERQFGEFRRVIRLGDDVDAEKVNAEYRDGVLKISVPKTESAQTKRIEVRS
ncbi:MAG: Hsp20/alpha crystallin family protein [Planctomycetes bacterium]|nr:Hsp20/alpha crystallin family protein [Planctomycetota bacterium]